jgi:hypothetical protein
MMPIEPRLPWQFRRLLDALTEEDRLRKFRISWAREPRDDDELQAFIEELARNLYNEGCDAWPEDDEEVD